MKSKLILLIMSFIGIVTLLFGCGNTYAYETNNNFTNTITSIYYNNSTQNLESFTTSSTNQWIRVKLNENITSNYVLLLNVKYSFNGSIGQSFLRYNPNGASSTYATRYIYNITNNALKSIAIDLNHSLFESGSSYLYFKIENANVTFVNIDLVPSSEIYLSYYYDTYISNLESQLSDLQDDYDNLENDYQSLESDLSDLQQNYDDLENEYQSLQSQFNIFNSSIIFNPINFTSKSLTLNNTTYDWNNYSVINYTGYDFTLFNRDISNMASYNSSSDNVYQEVITLNNYYQSNYWLIQGTFILSETYNDNFEIAFYDDLERVYTISYTDTLQQQSNSLYLNRNIRFNKFVITFNVNGTREFDNGEINLSIMGSYQNGYDLGYQHGNTIGYQNGYDYANSQFDSALEIAKQNSYNKGYNDASKLDENLVNNVIFSVAETPFAVFSQMLNFEIFGINFSGLFYGLLSMILVIFLIKKFMGK